MNKNAVISECGTYRYQLSRIWDTSKSYVLFIMLNPSTADSDLDDPTIRRCIGYAKSWGYGGLMVGNIFPYRATNPKELKVWRKNQNLLTEDILLQNRNHLTEMYAKCNITVCAWGNPPIKVLDKPLQGMRNLHYLELTNSGNPKHPLYLKKDLKPTQFEVILYR